VKTFKCDFGKGVSCEVKVPDLPERGTREVVWTGKPTEEMYAQYFAWLHSVNQQLADERGVRFTSFSMLAPGICEIWAYERGKAPKRIEAKHDK
jgi:hypothetical protein